MNKESKLEYILTNSYKKDMRAYMESSPGEFKELLELATSNKQPYSWRASWLLWSCMEENDSRVKGVIGKMVKILPTVPDGQQRELMIILQHMDINEKYEGILFDICTEIWKGIEKQPSVRFNAMKLMIKMTSKYPELQNEVKMLLSSEYMESLSRGVKHSLNLMLNKQKTK